MSESENVTIGNHESLFHKVPYESPPKEDVKIPIQGYSWLRFGKSLQSEKVSPGVII